MLENIVFSVIVAFLVILAWNSFIIIPEQYEYALEFLGKRKKMLKAGFHFISLIKFGWFYKIAKGVYVAEWQIPLFQSEDKGDSRHQINLVEFADISSKVDMYMLVKVKDGCSIKAAYSSTNPRPLMVKMMEAAVSNLLADVNVIDAIALKGEISLVALAKALEPEENRAKFNWLDETKLGGTKLFSSFKRWGYKILNVTLADVLLPEEVVLARKKVALSEIDKTVATKQQTVEKIKAETHRLVEKKKADAKKYEAEILANVSAFEVRQLMGENPGMAIKEALELIVQKAKWKAIQEGNASVFITDGSAASKGAEFGAGFHGSKKS
jgi:regulator of protease activity HflC (stomatin/prohibitin superfamily)